MENILPCPFCGSNNIEPRYIIRSAEMICMNCDAEGPVHNTKEEAIKAWNTRADAELSKTEVRLEDYAIALQQAIEHHCKGKKVPAEIALRCPYHAKMLDDTGKEE